MARLSSNKRTVQRRRMTWIAHDSDRDKTNRADASTCGIEIDPTGVWQIDLRPGMGRPTSWAARRLLRIGLWNSEISGYEPCGETKRPRRLDHQHGEITAAAMAEPKRLHWQLDSLRLSSAVEEALIDALRETDKKFENTGRPIWGQELTSPEAYLVTRIGLLAFDVMSEVRYFIAAIVDRKGPLGILEIEVWGVQWRMLKAYRALEAQLLCAARKPRYPNMIAKCVLNELQASRLRTDMEVRLDDFLVVGIARTEHYTMLAKGDGTSVAIGRDVANDQ